MEQVTQGSRYDGGGMVLLAVMVAVGALQRGVWVAVVRCKRGVWGGGKAHGGGHACEGHG
jgi:hypothetical protein